MKLSPSSPSSPRIALALLATAALVQAAALAAPALAQVRQPPPVIERLEPTAGPVGSSVEVIGRFFREDQRVSLGDVALPVTRRLPSRWTVTIPEGARTARVTIGLADGTSVVGPELRVLEALAAPRVTGFSPSAGAEGTEVRIVGENFSPRLTDNLVTLGSVSLVLRRATPTELTVIVPRGASSGRFVVRVARTGEASAESDFTIEAGTSITGFAPAVASPGSHVTISGVGFSARAALNRVFLENVPLRVVSASERELVVELPDRAQTGRLLVDVRGGARAYADAPLEVFPAPSIASVEPSAGTVGARIHLRGTNFGTDIRRVSAAIGERSLVVRAVTPTDVTLEIPEGAAGGPIALVVNGLPAVTSPAPFEVLTPVAVRGLEPISGPVGTEVTIRGEGFSPVLAHDHVTLAGIDCPVVAASPTELRVQIPQAGSGPLVVTVENAGTARTTQPFVITTPPFIARMEPTSGAVGAIVRLFGTSFGTNPAVVEVALAGRRMDVRSIRDTELEVVVPRGASSGRISVTVRLQGTGSSSVDFTVLGDFALSGAEPEEAHAGRAIALRGQGFVEDGLSVTFSGSGAPAPFTFVSSGELRVLVPDDAASGPITVRLADGRALETRPVTISAAPAGIGVGYVEPRCARAGCVVVLHGWGFGARPSAQRVTFDGRPVRVRRASAHRLELTLPRGAGTAPFEVTVPGQAPARSEPFTIER